MLPMREVTRGAPSQGSRVESATRTLSLTHQLIQGNVNDEAHRAKR